ncbi:TrpB-like pyridoxal phosphate-dependent enzyme [Candidatus Bathyarchaeota archaeon]|nr:TrpB-like pyridoxal phosphate-dependent enzyme [Candidatus Bathyarchaeota archaeon]
MDKKILLEEDHIPKNWYNILPDLPKPLLPFIDPGTNKPVDPRKLEVIFSKELLRQEISKERFIHIPEEIRGVYRLWRPTPLIRASRLEKDLKTPARIYFKYEGVSPTGSHKPNTAVAQVYYNMKEGTNRLTTETGAGQWGSALAFSGMLFDLDVIIYMVRVSYEQKPYRKLMMQLFGADVYSSPSKRTEIGRKILSEDPNSTGSLGIAISEAVEECLHSEATKYALGSVLNHVLMHQTVIGLEAKEQLSQADDYPNIVVGCVGGGSNFCGIAWPFYYDKIFGKAPKQVELTAVEPTACPSMSHGEFLYDHGDTGRITPLIAMYTLGHNFVPDPIHAGGLRYHGVAPSLSLMVREGIVNVLAYNQLEVFSAAAQFLRSEGIIPAPESAHAIKAVIDEAIRCREKKEEKTMLFNLSGHGYFDMKAYDDYLSGRLEACPLPEDKIAQSLKSLKNLYPWINA